MAMLTVFFGTVVIFILFHVFKRYLRRNSTSKFSRHYVSINTDMGSIQGDSKSCAPLYGSRQENRSTISPMRSSD